jgi:hypothetical protein
MLPLKEGAIADSAVGDTLASKFELARDIQFAGVAAGGDDYDVG